VTNTESRVISSRSSPLLVQQLASKEDEVIALTKVQLDLEQQVRETARSNESMRSQLEASLRNLARANQHIVELRLQGIDFKAEIDRRCDNVQKTVDQQMGFIPRAVQKQMIYLQTLKVNLLVNTCSDLLFVTHVLLLQFFYCLFVSTLLFPQRVTR
jgi:chromosome segregation ATPase